MDVDAESYTVSQAAEPVAAEARGERMERMVAAAMVNFILNVLV